MSFSSNSIPHLFFSFWLGCYGRHENSMECFFPVQESVHLRNCKFNPLFCLRNGFYPLCPRNERNTAKLAAAHLINHDWSWRSFVVQVTSDRGPLWCPAQTKCGWESEPFTVQHWATFPVGPAQKWQIPMTVQRPWSARGACLEGIGLWRESHHRARRSGWGCCVQNPRRWQRGQENGPNHFGKPPPRFQQQTRNMF